MDGHKCIARVSEATYLEDVAVGVVHLDLIEHGGDGILRSLGHIVMARDVFVFLAGEEPIPRRHYDLTLISSAN